MRVKKREKTEAGEEVIQVKQTCVVFRDIFLLLFPFFHSKHSFSDTGIITMLSIDFLLLPLLVVT